MDNQVAMSAPSVPPSHLPINPITEIDAGLKSVTCFEFHPTHDDIIAVGTEEAGVTLLRIGSESCISFGVRNYPKNQSTAFAKKPKVLMPVSCLKWSVSGLYLGIGYKENLVLVYTFQKNVAKEFCEILAHKGCVTDISYFHKDEKYLMVTCGQDRLVKIWNLVTGTNLITLGGHLFPPRKIYLHQIEQTMFLYAIDNDGKLKFWSDKDFGQHYNMDQDGYFMRRLVPAKSSIFASSLDRNNCPTIIKWDLSGDKRNFSRKQTYKGLGEVWLSYDFDTDYKIVVAVIGNSLKFWDVNDDTCLWSEVSPMPKVVPRVRLSKNGIFLAVLTRDKTVNIKGTTAGQEAASANGRAANMQLQMAGESGFSQIRGLAYEIQDKECKPLLEALLGFR